MIVFIVRMKVVVITMVTVTTMMLTMMTTIVLRMVAVMVLLVITVKVIVLIGPQGDAWIHFRSAFFFPLCPQVKCKRPPRGIFMEQNA